MPEGREVDKAWWAFLLFPAVAGGASPQSVTLYLLAHKPLEATVDSVGRRQLLLFQCLNVFCTHLGCEQLHWLQSKARDVCGSAPSSEPKTCLFQGELPGSEVTKSALQVLSHTHPLQIQANIPKLGRAFLPLKSKGLLRMQRGFLLLFPSHSITAGHRQTEAAFYMQIFGTH